MPKNANLLKARVRAENQQPESASLVFATTGMGR